MYVPPTKFIVSVVSEVTKKDWRQWNSTRSSNIPSFCVVFVRSTIIRRKFFVQQIIWFPFPSFCWLSSLSLLSLKYRKRKKEKKIKIEKKKAWCLCTRSGNNDHISCLLLSPCHYRGVGGSCALKGTRGCVHGVRECVSAWSAHATRSVYVQMSMTSKNRPTLRNEKSLTLFGCTYASIESRNGFYDEEFHLFDDPRLIQMRLCYVGWCTTWWCDDRVFFWFLCGFCVNEDVREERACNWSSLLDSIESLKLSLITRFTLTNVMAWYWDS